jgi:hypothetical protein
MLALGVTQHLADVMGTATDGQEGRETVPSIVASPEQTFLTPISLNNADFWDIQTQFIPRRKHYVSAM